MNFRRTSFIALVCLAGCNDNDHTAEKVSPTFTETKAAASRTVAPDQRTSVSPGLVSVTTRTTDTPNGAKPSAPAVFIPQSGANVAVRVGVATDSPDENLTLASSVTDDTFDGIGGIVDSAPLLHNYREPQRTEILDYLFKPNFGQAVQVLKLEIGGDANSTVNAEPAYQHTATDTPNVMNGYEAWIAQEALKRNPKIKIWGLQWTAPGWIGSICSQKGDDYLVKWIQLMKSQAGVNVDYISAGQNEKNCNAGDEFSDEQNIQALRKSLDDAGLSNVRVIGFDGSGVPTLSQETIRALYAIGDHYPGGWQAPLGWGPTDKTSKKYTDHGLRYWASEDTDFQSVASPPGRFTKQYNFRYLRYNTTLILNWTLIGAAYQNMEYMEESSTSSPSQMALFAEEPWSGHYTIYGPPFWSMAHTTQFTEPGWKYVRSASKRLGNGGSIVSYRNGSGDEQDWTSVIETTDSVLAQTIRLRLGSGFNKGTYRVFTSNAYHNSYFEDLGKFSSPDGVITVEVQPHSIVTISSLVANGGKGEAAAHAPASKAFPASYTENFESYNVNDYNIGYFAVLQGAFSIQNCASGHGGKCVGQVAAPDPILWSPPTRDPVAMIGDIKADDQTVSADVLLPDTGAETYASIGGHANFARTAGGSYGGYRGYELRITGTNKWELSTDTPNRTVVDSGELKGSATQWHNLMLQFSGGKVSARIDGEEVSKPAGVVSNLSKGMSAILSSFSPVQFGTFAVTSGSSKTQ
jgi:hypothetical protein